MKQFIRKVRFKAEGGGGSFSINDGGPLLHELKIGFDISKGLTSSANTAKIELWNLSEGHRNAVGKELDDITLEAGYYPPDGGNNVGIIFKGQIRDVEHRREGPDIITLLQCGDGDKAFRRSTISKTFKKGTKVEDVVEELYKEFEKENISKGEMKFPKDMPPFERPYSMCGSCTRELDRLGRSRGFYWSVQNNTFEVIPGDGFNGGVKVISASSGMIDTPTITDNGVKVSCLLDPEVRPNRRVQIESSVLEMNAESGMYRVSQVAYSGDNQDGDFRCEIQGESVKGGKVDEGKRK